MQSTIYKNSSPSEKSTRSLTESGYGSSETISLDQTNKALPNRENKHIPLLHAAIKQNNLSATKDLLNNKNNQVDLDAGLALALGNKDIDLKIVVSLLKKGANFKQEDQKSLLELVIKKNATSTFKKLLDNRYGLLTKNNLNDALHLTAQYKRSDMATKLLVLKKADASYKNEQGNTALHTAVMYDSKEVVNLLLKNAPDTQFIFNKDQASPLHLAADNGNLELAQRLLQAKNHYKSTISYQLTKYARQLKSSFFASKKQPNLMAMSTTNGDTPLHLAAKSGNETLLSILSKQSNVDLLRRNNQGQTASEILESDKQAKDTSAEISSSNVSPSPSR